jgi:hypothetical protein
MPAPVLQIKRGAAANIGIASLRAGEPGFTTDKHDFYIGLDAIAANQKFFGSARYWKREDATNAAQLKLVDKDGTNYVAIKAPDSLAGIVTYRLPGTQGGASSVLTNDGSGGLSWASGSANPVFTGIASFTDTTDNTLGNPDTGAVQIDGGLGVNKNVTVGAGLSVTGQSHFIGTATFYGGTINLGDSDTDDIVVSGEFASNLIPNADATYNLGTGAKRWRHASFSGIGTFATGLVADNVRLGIGGNGVVDTTSGPLYLDSAVGTTIINDRLNVLGDIDVSGSVYIGGTTVSLRGQEVFIENRDIVLGFTTSVTPNDTTANHGGIAIASTEGTPLSDFTADPGINTFPKTYKQLMWFKSGTLGFATDAFAFNYGVAIGTTTMADGIRLAVGSGITMSDTEISATNFYGTFNGSITGNAPSADQVKTVTAADANATYHLTFVDANNGSATNETVYTDAEITYNPSTNKLTTQNADFTGNVNVSGVATVAGSFKANNFISTSTTLQPPTIGNFDGERIRLYNFDSPSNTNYAIGAENNHIWFGVDNYGDSQGFKWYGEETQVMRLGGTGNLTIAGALSVAGVTTIGTGVGITQFSGSVSTGTSTSSVPTSKAVIDYVGTQIGNVDLTLGINADTGGPSTVTTSQTLTISGTTNEVNTSVSGQTITVGLPDTVNITTLLDVPTVEATNLKARDGTTAITITDSTGAVATNGNLTVGGDLFVNGSTTQVNTTALTVEDRTIDLGIVNGAAPASATTWDLGILFNYNSSGAKKSAVVWEHADTRFKFASVLGADTDGTDANTPQLTVTTFAPIEIGSLWVTDCAGTSQVISCTGTTRNLENITVDAGTF